MNTIKWEMGVIENIREYHVLVAIHECFLVVTIIRCTSLWHLCNRHKCLLVNAVHMGNL